MEIVSKKYEACICVLTCMGSFFVGTSDFPIHAKYHPVFLNFLPKQFIFIKLLNQLYTKLFIHFPFILFHQLFYLLIQQFVLSSPPHSYFFFHFPLQYFLMCFSLPLYRVLYLICLPLTSTAPLNTLNTSLTLAPSSTVILASLFLACLLASSFHIPL